MSLTTTDRQRMNAEIRDVLAPWIERFDAERAQTQRAENERLRECLRGVVEQLADMAALTTDTEQLEAALEAVEACGDDRLAEHYRRVLATSRMAQLSQIARAG